MTPFQLIVFSIATWRVASLFVNEDGPWFIFEKLRYEAGIRNMEIGPGFLAQLLSCTWCFSLYVGVGWTLFYLWQPKIAFLCACAFALSAITIFVHAILDRLGAV